MHAAEPETEDVETFAARRRRMKSRRKQATRSSRWTAAILVLFAFNVALIGGRNEVVRYLPQTASLFAAIGLPVNLHHLKFENVRILPSGTGGEGLAVEGTDREHRQQAGEGAAICALPRATPPDRKSTPGPWRPDARCSIPAPSSISAATRFAAGRRQGCAGALPHGARNRRLPPAR